MDLVAKGFFYKDQEHYLEIKNQLDNGLFLNLDLYFEQKRFLEFQKNLIQDFIAELIDEISDIQSDLIAIKTTFELRLQNLNAKLSAFAEKVTDIDKFPIHGYVQIVSLGTLLTSLIGDVSLMIFRDRRLYYELYNSLYDDTKIDVFSDFIEGELDVNDELLYIGQDFKENIDIEAIYNMQDSLANKKTSVKTVSLLNEYLHSQDLQEGALFLVGHTFSNVDMVGGISNKVGLMQKFSKFNSNGGKISRFTSKLGKTFALNKYYITVGILCILVLFMLYNVLNQLLEKQNIDKFLTDSGVEVTLTIDKLKNEIFEFKTMNPKSNQKSQKYAEIVKQMELLEGKGKWLADIADLKKILQKDYYEGFNIKLVSDMSIFNDAALGATAQILTFNDTEKEKLGDLKTLNYNKGLYIGASKGSVINALNDGSRGALIEYLIENPMKACSINLLRNGLYCYSENSELFNITKEGIVPVTIVDSQLPDTIGGLSIYGRLNLYIFQPNLTSSLPGVFATRYTNERGSQVSFTRPTNYTLLDIDTGAVAELDASSEFVNPTIDGNFLVWSNKKLYQLWRPSSASVLDVRQVPLIGGDKLSSLSDNVKVISDYGSQYVYLFDKTNHSFFVYTSEPNRTTEKGEKTYALTYLFSFKFELPKGEEVIDITTDVNSVQRPEAYVLTNDAVYKINLYNFIQTYSL